MKYKPEDYINSGFYDGDDTVIEHHKAKIVTCRKPHECMGACGATIKVGENALYESGFEDGQPVSCYTCIPCLDEWLDFINGVTDADEYDGSYGRRAAMKEDEHG